MAATFSRSTLMIGVTLLALYAARPEPAYGGGEKKHPRGEGATVNKDLFEILKKHYPADIARSIAGQALPQIFEKPVKPSPTDDKIEELAKERYNGILALIAQPYLYPPNPVDNERILSWSRQLLAVGLEIHRRPREAVAFLNQMAGFCDKMVTKVNSYRYESDKPYGRLEWRVFDMQVRGELLRVQKREKQRQ